MSSPAEHSADDAAREKNASQASASHGEVSKPSGVHDDAHDHAADRVREPRDAIDDDDTTADAGEDQPVAGSAEAAAIVATPSSSSKLGRKRTASSASKRGTKARAAKNEARRPKKSAKQGLLQHQGDGSVRSTPRSPMFRVDSPRPLILTGDMVDEEGLENLVKLFRVLMEIDDEARKENAREARQEGGAE